MSDILLTEARDGVQFEARVTPRASKSGISGARDGRLLVRVTAPPVDAAANAAVIALLADVLEIAPRRITVAAGERTRTKRFIVAGLTADQVRERLTRT